MNTRVKRTTLFALVMSLLVSVCVFALPQQEAHAASKPGEAAYYAERWQECVVKVSPTQTALPAWNGIDAGTVPNGAGDGSRENPYIVDTPEEFRYCLKQNLSCKLDADLNLGWYRNADGSDAGPNWCASGIDITRGMVVDGNGHTIYNLRATGGANVGLIGSVAGGLQDPDTGFVIKNLNLQGANVYNSGSYTCAASLIAQFRSGTAQNCHVSNALVNSANGAGCGTGGVFAPESKGSTGLTIKDTIAENVNVYGASCVSGFIEGPWGSGSTGHVNCTGKLIIENCAAVNGTVISTGGHSGGFTSCVRISEGSYYKNCYTNLDVYGNNETGVFVGVTHQGTHQFDNCYAAGKIEGTTQIGGFFGCPSSSARETFTNCYSTSMVGMSDGGNYMGGFAGQGAASSNFINCYAAGEVGSLKSKPDGTPIGTSNVTGFSGNNAGNFTNCYYDKQTTGMCNHGEEPANVTGLLTKQLFTMDLGDDWQLSEGSYPELKAFASGDPMAKAYSSASVATVQLWSNLDAYLKDPTNITNYDTVRKIRYVFPLTNNQNSGKPSFDIRWSNYVGEDPAHPLYPNKSPLMKDDVPIITLSGVGSNDNVSSVAPGIGWLQVNATDKGTGDVGMRRLRLVPTTAIATAAFGDVQLGLQDTVCSTPDPGIEDLDGYKSLAVNDSFDHRDTISFVTATADTINSFILDDTNISLEDKLLKYDIKTIPFPKNDATKEILETSDKEGILKYSLGAAVDNGFLEVKLYRQTTDGSFEKIPWDDYYIALFEGGEVKPEDRGVYQFDYEWTNATGVLQAQGTKYITLAAPAHVVYHVMKDSTITKPDDAFVAPDSIKPADNRYEIAFVDPGSYPVGGKVGDDNFFTLDNYEMVGHGKYYWSTSPKELVGDAQALAELDTSKTEFTSATALKSGRNDVYATWIPNPHDVTIQKSTDPADGNVDPADVPQFNYGDKVLDKLDEIGAPEKVNNPAGEAPIGWQISYATPDPDNPGENKTVTEVVTSDTTMPDADVTIMPLWGISPSLTKSVVNNTHPGQENNVGDELTYTITATNNGPQSTWKDVTITDVLPAGVTFMPDSIKLFKNSTVAENGSNDLYTNDNHTLAWNVGNIGYQETYTVTFNVKINSDAIAVGNDDAAKAKRDIANTAQVTDSKNSNDEPADKDKPITTDPVTPNPDKVADPKDPWPVTPFDPEPSIEKKVTNDTDPEGYLQVGDRLTYDIEVENKKPDSVWKGVVVKDTLPEGVDIVPGTIELVKPDGTVVPLPDTAYDPETRTVKVEVGSISGNDPEPYHITFKVDINEKPITGNPEDKPIGSAPEAEGTMPHGEEADVAVNDPVYPEYLDDTNVYWADPYSEVTKTAQNMSRDTAPTHVGDTVRYILTAENTKANSLWKDVVFFDKIPQGLEIDTASIALVDPEGKTHSVSAQAYDAKTRILAVFAGDLLVNQKATLSFEVKVVEAALNKDIGNVGMAKGGTDVPNGGWVEAGPYSVGDGYHPQGGGEQIPEGVIATGAVYPFPEDNINEFFDGHRGGVVNVDGSPATSDFTFALAGGVGVLTLAALATVVYTRRKMKTKA